MENTENSETDYFLILFSSFTHTKQRRAIIIDMADYTLIISSSTEEIGVRKPLIQNWAEQNRYFPSFLLR